MNIDLSDVDMSAGVAILTAEPDHDHCPGGFHLPGLIGGWHCPCPCHQGVSTT